MRERQASGSVAGTSTTRAKRPSARDPGGASLNPLTATVRTSERPTRLEVVVREPGGSGFETGGYHVAFVVGAVFAAGAALLGAVLLRASAAPAAAIHGEVEEESEPAAEAA
jgi:hypothetical protein